MKCIICNSDSDYYLSKIFSESPIDEFMREIGKVDYYKCNCCGFVLSRISQTQQPRQLRQPDLRHDHRHRHGTPVPQVHGSRGVWVGGLFAMLQAWFNLLWADNDGHHFVLDRGSGDAKTAQEPRYNRFKAGHPSGFIEAFANLYADIAGELRSIKEGRYECSEFVFGASHSMEGLHFLEKISESAIAGEWVSM